MKAQAYQNMMKRQQQELTDFPIVYAFNEKQNEQFAEEAFRYEMDNHEYVINWSGDEDVLAALCLDKQMIKDFYLEDAYRRARNGHMRYMEELGVI